VTLLVFLAALASAFFHAGWNAVARRQEDPGAGLALVVIMAGVVSVPGLAYVGPPATPSLPWMAVACGCNLVTMRVMMATYRRMPFNLAYPLVRGISPLAVAVLGYLLFSYTLAPLAIVGVGIISVAVLMLAASSRIGASIPLGATALALAAGISNAFFSIADARGVRLSENLLGYSFMVAIVNAFLVSGMMLVERSGLVAAVKRYWKVGLVGCMGSMSSYLLMVYGFANGPVAAVSALRETSIFFSVLIAAIFLREQVGPLRWGAVAVAVVGIAMLRLS
jgi:drug/metabolite transporter (DMT)-like permease